MCPYIKIQYIVYRHSYFRYLESNLKTLLFFYSTGNWENDGERMMVPGNQNMAAVLDLRPATTYHLRIVARNEIGDSDPSDIVTIITAEEGKPFSLKI